MKRKILFVISLLFGLMFINAGLNKFFNYMPMPKDMPENMNRVMAALIQIKWLLPLVGIAEIIGGGLFITNKYRALGAIIILPVTIGVFLTNLFDAPSGLPLALVLLLINIWVIVENRYKYLPMINDTYPVK